MQLASRLLFHGKVTKNEHLSHHPVSATADARDSVPLCVRRVYQSESVSVYLLLYRMGLLCTVYRDHHSTFPRLRPLSLNCGLVARGVASIVASSPNESTKLRHTSMATPLPHTHHGTGCRLTHMFFLASRALSPILLIPHFRRIFPDIINTMRG